MYVSLRSIRICTRLLYLSAIVYAGVHVAVGRHHGFDHVMRDDGGLWEGVLLGGHSEDGRYSDGHLPKYGLETKGR